jgi:general secretion pathway protein A
MSGRHKEAMAHLSYGLSQGGCFIVLTGEVGTGKTTLCRNLLNDLPEDVEVALILNANINEQELLQTVCDELKVSYKEGYSQKQLLDQIYRHLLVKFADNQQTVLIIDEAQLLQRDVLEQIRLLTNLETTKSKLLQIILIGQPELNDVLSRNDLRQLAQRVTARYHLGALQKNEIEDYVNFRLRVAGCRKPLFTKQALSQLFKLTEGIPRRINVLADHALLSAYSKTQVLVDAKSVKSASNEVFIQANTKKVDTKLKSKWLWFAMVLVVFNGLMWLWFAKTSEVVLPSNIAIQESSDMAALNGQAAISGAELSVSDVVGQNQAATLAVNADEPLVTTIITEEDISPGSVLISDEFLDGEPVLVNPNPPTVEKLIYNASSEFGKVLDASSDVTGRIAAFRGLAQAWDVSLPKKILGSVCGELDKSGVRCAEVGSWGRLMRFNRPTILVLEQRNQLHRVIVFSVEQQTAQVLMGENVVSVPVAELQSRWTKSGIAFWRPGVMSGVLLQEGDVNNEMPNVRLNINKALSMLNMPISANVDSVEFDAELAQKVFALQSRFSILADGKVGVETYLLMNEVLAADTTPTLRSRVQ